MHWSRIHALIVTKVYRSSTTLQDHNAKQLPNWCLHFIANNYEFFESRDEFWELTADHLAFMEVHQWPPISYHQDLARYKAESARYEAQRKKQDNQVEVHDHPTSKPNTNSVSTHSQQQRQPMVYGHMHPGRSTGLQRVEFVDFRRAGQAPTTVNTGAPYRGFNSHQSHYPHGPPHQNRYRQYTQNDPGFCTYCGENNHRSDSCKYGQPIYCFRCHTAGHKAKFCRSRGVNRQGRFATPRR